MYLKRKVDAFLSEWKEVPDRKPLIIKGSRQVGKTESVLHFAAEHYESIIEINFVRDEKYKGIISDGYEVSTIIKNISLIDPSKRFIPGKTLIFFDEITAFPEIATSLNIKYLFFMILAIMLTDSSMTLDVKKSSAEETNEEIISKPDTEKSKATVSGTKRTTICTRWTLRSSCGPKGMGRIPSQIYYHICRILNPSASWK